MSGRCQRHLKYWMIVAFCRSWVKSPEMLKGKNDDWGFWNQRFFRSQNSSDISYE